MEKMTSSATTCSSRWSGRSGMVDLLRRAARGRREGRRRRRWVEVEGLGEPVAVAPAVDDQSAGSGGGQFAAESAGVTVDGTGAARSLPAPDELHQLRFAEDAIGIPGQRQKEAEFLFRDFDDAAMDERAACGALDRQRPEGD